MTSTASLAEWASYLCLILALTASPAWGEETLSLHQQIDQLILSTDESAGTAVSTDADFLRRVMLDFAGRIPTSSEVREFVAQTDVNKRDLLIDRLLSSPAYARRMRDQMHVMLMERLGEDEAWLTWLEQSFRENKPWSQMVRELIDPDADHELNRGAAFFWTKRLENYGQNPIDFPALTRDVGRLFLGVDLQCAQCHDHIFIDDYKQADYHGLFAFFSETYIRKDVTFPAVGEKPLMTPLEFTSVFTQESQTTGPRLPHGEEITIPTFPKGEEFEIPPDKKTKFPGRPRFRPLATLAEQVTADDNTQFAANSVNRFWFLMFGRGLVHPLDLHHSGNPATHPEVLDLMAREFVAHNYDVKWLLRELAMTQAYQRPSRSIDNSVPVPANSYLLAWERPLSAEQLLAGTAVALGHPLLSPPVLKDDVSERSDKSYGTAIKEFREVFANVPRDPEGEFRPSVKAALFLMNDREILAWFGESKPGTTLHRLLQTSNEQVAEELYLAALSRFPTESETAFVHELLTTSTLDRTHLLSHLLWGLVASSEFALNH